MSTAQTASQEKLAAHCAHKTQASRRLVINRGSHQSGVVINQKVGSTLHKQTQASGQAGS
jgi:hypothetical protein